MPISLDDKVDKEIHRLITESHIIKLQECSDRQFFSPIVIKVKKGWKYNLGIGIKRTQLAGTQK